MKILISHAPTLLVRELISRGHELVVADAPGHWRETPPGAERCRFQPFPFRQKADPRAAWEMARLIANHQPDLVHAFSPRSLAAAVLATTFMRSATAIMSFRGIATSPKWIDVAEYLTFLSPRVAGHACESEAVADGLVAAGVPRSSCCVIYNCVDRAALAVQDRNVVRERFGIPADAFVLGSIASVRPVKGIDILLRAALACRDLPDIHVLLMGGVRDRRVERLCRDPRWNGRLHLAGHVPGAGGMGRAFDVFVMPSRSEGLCRALLEATCLGVCPVVSDAGGMKELVRHEREGLVFPSEDVLALENAIRHLHANRGLIPQYGREAEIRVSKICSPRAMADRVEQGYIDLLGGGRSRPADKLRSAA